MDRLSFTQEFFLCTVTKRGRIPDATCLILGGIVELLELGYIGQTDKGLLEPAKPWYDGPLYLKPVYDRIASSKKPMAAARVVESIGAKPVKELVSEYRASLIESGCADEITRMNKKRPGFTPRMEAVKKIVDKIRAGLLSETALSTDVILLVTLLDAVGKASEYFSKFERKELKKRIKEVRESEAGALIRDTLAVFSDAAVAATATAVVVN